MMKILILQDFLRGGGTEQQVVFLATYFKKEGHEVVLLTFRPSGRLIGRLANSGIHWYSLQRFDLGLSFFAPGIFEALRNEAPDVILCMGRMANYYAGFIQRKNREIPVVGSVRTGKKVSVLYRWSLRQVRAIIVNSLWWRNQLERIGVNLEKVELIYNSMVLPLDRKIDDAERIRLRSQFCVGPSQCIFLNVANFRKGKRQQRLIQIFSRLRGTCDWQLWFLGEGRELRRCQETARTYGIDRQVRFFNFSHQPRIFYAASDVAVSASVEDSLPNFIIEAQAMGLPVIASDTGGVRESFLPEGSGFLIPSDDDTSFHRALMHLKANPRLREKFGKEGISYAMKQFSGEKQAREVLDLLKRIVEVNKLCASSL